ncbi:hypothetical protein [Nocardioides sp. MH1]|uniref:hypothetical protein n=1 Tax=Nocardioides sp. MH1 TaxID=3242490 RepID=UPI0035211341
MTPPVASEIAGTASSAAGKVLAGASRTLAWTRPSRKPLHPAGDVLVGRLVRTGGQPPSGATWLDTAGEDEVLVRLSRAVGLPRPLPDIHGLAVRIPTGDHDFADLLLATTGLGRLGRFVLLPERSTGRRALTSLLPYRGPRGPVLIAARPVADLELPGPARPAFELMWASPAGPWVTFGRLDLSETSGPDPAISFDPVRNPLPDLTFYRWVQRLRAPAYRAARDASGR